MFRKFIKQLNEKGSLMVEAMAMLGLIAMVTPILYKKASERTTELQDINSSSEMRSLIRAVDDYLKDNYSAIVAGETVTRASQQVPSVDFSNFVGATEASKRFDIRHLEEYLPYGFLDQDGKINANAKNFLNYEVAIKKVAALGDSRKKSLTGFVFAFPKQGTDFPVVRASRIASMIGSNGGFALTDNVAKGVQGVWEVSDTVSALDVTAPKATVIAASMQPVSASAAGDLDDVLYRVYKTDQKLNTMETTLHMGEQTIDRVNQIIVTSSGETGNWSTDTGKDPDYALWLNETTGSAGAPGATIAGRIMAASGRFLVNADGMAINNGTDVMMSVDSDTGDTVIEGTLNVGGEPNVGVLGDEPKLHVWGNAFVHGVLRMLQLKSDIVDAGKLRAGTDNVEKDNDTDYNMIVDKDAMTMGVDRFRIAGDTGDAATAGNLYVQGQTNLGGNFTVGTLNPGVISPTFIDDQANTRMRIYQDTGDVVSRGGFYFMPGRDVNGNALTNYNIDQMRNSPTLYSGMYFAGQTTSGREGWPEFVMTSHRGTFAGDMYTVPKEVFSVRRRPTSMNDPFLGAGGDVVSDTYLFDFVVSQARFKVETGGLRRQLDITPAEVAVMRSKNMPKGMISVTQSGGTYGDNDPNVIFYNSQDAATGASWQNTHKGGSLLMVNNWTNNWADASNSFAANKPIIDSVRIGRALIEVADREANEKTFAAGQITEMNPVFRVTGGYNPDTDNNKGSVNVRKGVVQIATNQPDTLAVPSSSYYGNYTLSPNIHEEDEASRGYLQTDRMISNKVLDHSRSLPVDTKESNSGSVKYDSFQVNPAFTSVMHDIKLTTRGGARLSDILPDFVNKGIYVVDNTYSESFTGGGTWDTKITISNGQPSGVSASCTEYDCNTTPWLGFIPKPQCPPNYAKVITATPAGWAMAQAGMPKTADNANYVVDVENNYWPISPDVITDENDSRFPRPLYFQKSTWLRVNVIPTGSNCTANSCKSDSDFQGWHVVMGFIYPYNFYKGYIEAENNNLGLNSGISGADDSTIVWNLFPVKRKELEGYATVYCYFDRTDEVYDPHYVDKYDQLNMYRSGYDKKGYYVRRYNSAGESIGNYPNDSSTTYKDRLNDTNGYLQYDNQW